MTAARSKQRAGKAAGYDAASLGQLVGLDAVRKRPAMYIGSTDTKGLTHCLFEIFDNAVDEALAGHASQITVRAHPDGSAEVCDDGRGIPVDIEPNSGVPGVVFVLTNLHAGGKFGGEGYKVSGGLHGVGASAVNALSSRLEVQVDRDGATHSIAFRRGEPGHFDSKGKFSPGAKLKRSGRLKKSDTGTRVRFWPDAAIFAEGAEIDWDRVTDRLHQTAYLVPRLTIRFEDLRNDEAAVREFSASGGLKDFISEIAPDDELIEVLSLTGHGSFTSTQQVLHDGELVSTPVERDVEVEVALRWGKGWDYTIRSFVNVVETPAGGAHVAGFERALVKAIQTGISATRVLKANEESPVKDDVLEGLTAAVYVRVPEPEFVGQTKDALGDAPVAGIVAAVVADGLGRWLDAPRNRRSARSVFEKVAEAARARRAAKSQRELVRRKSALESASMPDKLKDCRSHDIDRSELILIEGDSAAGTVAKARDSEFQAYLPLRGKILNVLRKGEREMLANEECAALITALGAGSGRTFQLDKSRYGKLVLLADADVDGSHIRCLLLTLVWRYMRPLLEAGRVYAAMPPLYQLQLSGGGAVWAYTDGDRDQKLAALADAGRDVKHIQRMKGLGEMSVEQLADTTLDVATRRMRRITIRDAAEAERLFEVLMGRDVPERKAFIYERSDGFELTRLDL